jgi:hypothetical protein
MPWGWYNYTVHGVVLKKSESPHPPSPSVNSPADDVRRLKKLVAERDLEIKVMKEVAAKNW